MSEPTAPNLFRDLTRVGADGIEHREERASVRVRIDDDEDLRTEDGWRTSRAFVSGEVPLLAGDVVVGSDMDEPMRRWLLLVTEAEGMPAERFYVVRRVRELAPVEFLPERRRISRRWPRQAPPPITYRETTEADVVALRAKLDYFEAKYGVESKYVNTNRVFRGPDGELEETADWSEVWDEWQLLTEDDE